MNHIGFNDDEDNDSVTLYTEDTPRQPGFSKVVSGTHRCRVLKAVKQIAGPNTPEWMRGRKEVLWQFQIIGGPSNKATFFYSTALTGEFPSPSKPGKMLNADWRYKNLVLALHPTMEAMKGIPILLRDHIGKDCEMNLEAILKNGVSSAFPKVLSVHPWIHPGDAGDSMVLDSDSDLAF